MRYEYTLVPYNEFLIKQELEHVEDQDTGYGIGSCITRDEWDSDEWPPKRYYQTELFTQQCLQDIEEKIIPMFGEGTYYFKFGPHPKTIEGMRYESNLVYWIGSFHKIITHPTHILTGWNKISDSNADRDLIIQHLIDNNYRVNTESPYWIVDPWG